MNKTLNVYMSRFSAFWSLGDPDMIQVSMSSGAQSDISICG